MIGRSAAGDSRTPGSAPDSAPATDAAMAPTSTAVTKVANPVPGPNRHGRTGTRRMRHQPEPAKTAAASPPTSSGIHDGAEVVASPAVGAAATLPTAGPATKPTTMTTPPTLADIVEHTRAEVEARRAALPLETLRGRVSDTPPPRNFFSAVATGSGPGGVNVIAEVKRRSPSAGEIRANFDPVDIALQYENAGAVAISCLTDERFFGGSLDTIGLIKEVVRIPVLRKDFIVDTWQIWESRAAGADAILLISECLSEGQLMDMLILAHELDMTALVEVHDMENLLRVRRHVGFPHPGYMLLGINNRNLRTMTTDISHTIRMLELVEDHREILVTESGIGTTADVERMVRHGVRRFLIGQRLLRQG